MKILIIKSCGITYPARRKSFGKKGYLINPAIGVCIRVYEKSALYLGFEIEVQQMEFVNYYDFYFGYTNEIKNSYSMSLNLGLTF